MYVRAGGAAGAARITLLSIGPLIGNVAQDVVHTTHTDYESWYNSIAFGLFIDQNHRTVKLHRAGSTRRSS